MLNIRDGDLLTDSPFLIKGNAWTKFAYDEILETCLPFPRANLPLCFSILFYEGDKISIFYRYNVNTKWHMQTASQS